MITFFNILVPKKFHVPFLFSLLYVWRCFDPRGAEIEVDLVQSSWGAGEEQLHSKV